MAKRRKKGFFAKLISGGYKALSRANTASVILSGNPAKIAKHGIRKLSVRKASKII